MALSIGPTEVLLAKSQQTTQKSIGVKGSPQATSAPLMQTSGDSFAVKTASQQTEESTSRTLFQASLSLTKREDITKKLQETTVEVLETAKAINAEVDPIKKEELKQEAAKLIEEAQKQYEAAIEEDPSLAENETYAAILKPGADPNDAAKTYSVTLGAAPSVQGLGLNDLSFEDADIEATITKLEYTVSNLGTQLTAQQSTNTSISSAVKSRISETSASERIKYTDTPEQQTEQLTKDIRNSYSLDSLPPVERLNFQALLAAEDAIRSTPAISEPSARPPEQANELMPDSGTPAAAAKLVQN
jgi:hypothetical protein